MSFPSLCSLIPGYKNGLHCMLSFLASLPHFNLAEATEIESACWLHPWRETHLRRNMGLSNLLDWERTWMQVSVTACVSSFTSRLACKGGWWPCLIRSCCPSASCQMPSEKTRLAVPGLLAQDAPREPSAAQQRCLHVSWLHRVTNFRTQNQSNDVCFAFFFSSAVQNLNDFYQCSESGPYYNARVLQRAEQSKEMHIYSNSSSGKKRSLAQADYGNHCSLTYKLLSGKVTTAHIILFLKLLRALWGKTSV